MGGGVFRSRRLRQGSFDPFACLCRKGIGFVLFNLLPVVGCGLPQKLHLTQKSGTKFAHEEVQSQGKPLSKREEIFLDNVFSIMELLVKGNFTHFTSRFGNHNESWGKKRRINRQMDIPRM